MGLPSSHLGKKSWIEAFQFPLIYFLFYNRKHRKTLMLWDPFVKVYRKTSVSASKFLFSCWPPCSQEQWVPIFYQRLLQDVLPGCYHVLAQASYCAHANFLAFIIYSSSITNGKADWWLCGSSVIFFLFVTLKYFPKQIFLKKMSWSGLQMR